MIWQMMAALLQLRTERDRDKEKGCQKPAVQQKTEQGPRYIADWEH